MAAGRRLLGAAALLLAAVAGCSSAQSLSPPVSHSATSAKPAPPRRAVSMQLPPRTSVGAGALARAWATAIVDKIVTRPTAADVTSLMAWFAAEDDHKPAGVFTYGAGENNPLNLTADSGDFPGVVGTEPSGAGLGHPGNLDFATPAQGVSATVAVIWVKYPVLAHALTSGRGLLNNPAVAAELSKWSGGGYSSLP